MMLDPEQVKAQLKERVYRHIEAYPSGFLHHSIYIILENDPALAIRVCQEFGIDRSNNLRSDLALLKRWNLYGSRGEETILDQVAVFANDITSNLGLSGNPQESNNTEKEKMENIEKVIFGACTVIGIFTAIYGLNNLNKSQERKKEDARIARAKLSEETLKKGTEYTRAGDNQYSRIPTRAELCLVVAAKEVSSRTVGQGLSIEDVKYLLENSPYFRCTSLTEAKESENKLIYADDPILPDSLREVYIRIEIDRGGRELIDKKFPYIVSTNIPKDAICTIKKMECLKDLTGLEKFETV